jgi:hypothetical protein
MLDLRASIMSSQIAQSESDAERRELPISELGSAVAEEAIKKEPLEGREYGVYDRRESNLCETGWVPLFGVRCAKCSRYL